jgi:hypothetical protein
MPVKYEWRETRNGRRFVRTVVPDAAPVKVPKEAVAEAEYVPEIKIEPAEDEAPKPKRGRPPKILSEPAADDE